MVPHTSHYSIIGYVITPQQTRGPSTSKAHLQAVLSPLIRLPGGTHDAPIPLRRHMCCNIHTCIHKKECTLLFAGAVPATESDIHRILLYPALAPNQAKQYVASYF